MEQSDAIVLRVYPWSETSCVANIYTREHGKLSVLAKGAKRPKSPFEAALDLLSICRVVFIAKSADALDILTEAKLQRRFRAASQDLLRLNCGYYVAELLDRLTDKGDRQPEVFDLAQATLIDLEQTELEPRAVILRFELQMLRMVGHLPSWQRCVHCGNDARHVNDSIQTKPVDEDDDWLVFSVISGGVLCDACRMGARQTIRMHRKVQETLIEFSDTKWRTIRLKKLDAVKLDAGTHDSNHRSMVRKVVTRYLTALLDRKLQLHAYLEELGR